MNVDPGVLLVEVVMAVVGDATPGIEALAVLMVLSVEFEKDGLVPLESGVLVGKAPVPVGRALG